jgi:hypothetical protein
MVLGVVVQRHAANEWPILDEASGRARHGEVPNTMNTQPSKETLRRYFVVMPVVVADEPNACRIEFRVENQMFSFGPEYCEDQEDAEWFIDMAIKALQTLIAEVHS